MPIQHIHKLLAAIQNPDGGFLYEKGHYVYSLLNVLETLNYVSPYLMEEKIADDYSVRAMTMLAMANIGENLKVISRDRLFRSNHPQIFAAMDAEDVGGKQRNWFGLIRNDIFHTTDCAQLLPNDVEIIRSHWSRNISAYFELLNLVQTCFSHEVVTHGLTLQQLPVVTKLIEENIDEMQSAKLRAGYHKKPYPPQGQVDVIADAWSFIAPILAQPYAQLGDTDKATIQLVRIIIGNNLQTAAHGNADMNRLCGIGVRHNFAHITEFSELINLEAVTYNDLGRLGRAKFLEIKPQLATVVSRSKDLDDVAQDEAIIVRATKIIKMTQEEDIGKLLSQFEEQDKELFLNLPASKQFEIVMEVILNNDIKKLEVLLNYGFNPNQTAVMYPVKSERRPGSISVTFGMNKKSKYTEKFNFLGATDMLELMKYALVCPLSMAIELSNIDITKLLLKSGAEPLLDLHHIAACSHFIKLVVSHPELSELIMSNLNFDPTNVRQHELVRLLIFDMIKVNEFAVLLQNPLIAYNFNNIPEYSVQDRAKGGMMFNLLELCIAYGRAAEVRYFCDLENIIKFDDVRHLQGIISSKLYRGSEPQFSLILPVLQKYIEVCGAERFAEFSQYFLNIESDSQDVVRSFFKIIQANNTDKLREALQDSIKYSENYEDWSKKFERFFPNLPAPELSIAGFSKLHYHLMRSVLVESPAEDNKAFLTTVKSLDNKKDLEDKSCPILGGNVIEIAKKLDLKFIRMFLEREIPPKNPSRDM